ncbi:hypothetical protein AtNW77_Chr1g0042381 [Arabidopsis thaliana]
MTIPEHHPELEPAEQLVAEEQALAEPRRQMTRMVTSKSSSGVSANDQAIIDAITLQMEKIFDAKHKPINDQLKGIEQYEQISHQKEAKRNRPQEKHNWRSRPTKDESNCYYYIRDDHRRFEQARQQPNDVKEVKTMKQNRKESLASNEQLKDELLMILNAYNKLKKAKHPLPSNSEKAQIALPSKFTKDTCDLYEKTYFVLEIIKLVLEERSQKEGQRSLSSIVTDLEQQTISITEPILKELFGFSRTFDVFPLVFVKDNEKPVKDAILNIRKSYGFPNPFDYGSKEDMDQAWSEMKASEARTHLFGVWNWKYLRKTTTIAKGCSTLKYYFANGEHDMTIPEHHPKLEPAEQLIAEEQLGAEEQHVVEEALAKPRRQMTRSKTKLLNKAISDYPNTWTTTMMVAISFQDDW